MSDKIQHPMSLFIYNENLIKNIIYVAYIRSIRDKLFLTFCSVTFFWRRHRHRRVDNIRIDLQEVGWRYVDWIGLA